MARLVLRGLTALVASLAVVYVINVSRVLHPASPLAVKSMVYDARVVLGRWPRDWKELQRALGSMRSYQITTQKYESIWLEPGKGDECIAYAKSHSIIGLPYEDRIVIARDPEWERASNERIADIRRRALRP